MRDSTNPRYNIRKTPKTVTDDLPGAKDADSAFASCYYIPTSNIRIIVVDFDYSLYGVRVIISIYVKSKVLLRTWRGSS